MDFFGVGGFEMVAILVVALLVLGPEKMVDVARTAGKWWREAQLAVRAMADAATTKLDEEPPSKRNNAPPPSDPMPSPEDAVPRVTSDEPADGGFSPGPEDAPPADAAPEANDHSRAG